MGRIVGLVGTRGAGKDTVAAMLVAQGWRRTAFADKLYQEVAEGFKVPVSFLEKRSTKEVPQQLLALKHCSNVEFVAVALKAAGVASSVRRCLGKAARTLRPGMARRRKKALAQPRSPRAILQWWGTEYRRLLYRDDYWREVVRQQIVSRPDTMFVVTDVRFPDEAKLLVSLGGTLGRVVRPGLGGSADPALQHSSERAMLNYPTEVTLRNEEGPQGLRALAKQVNATLLGAPQTKAA